MNDNLHDNIRLIIRKLSLFSQIDDSNLESLINVLRIQRYAPNQYLSREGDYPEKIMIIIDGIAFFSCIALSGKHLVHGLFVEGDSICETPLLIKGRCLISVQACTSLSTIELCWTDFLRLCKKEPSILYKMNILLANRMRVLQELILDAIDLNTTQRIEKTLDKLGVIFNRTIPLTHQQIADMCITTRETVSRSLEKMRLDGKIDYSQNSKNERHIKIKM